MAFTSTFYNGPVDEIAWSEGAPRIGSSEYGVVGVNDFRVTAVSGQDRTVSVAAGKAWGKGVHDTMTPAETVQLPTVGAGSRWDLIAIRRVWSTNTTSIVRVGGSGTRGIPAGRQSGYGTTDDQPIALVRVQAGSTTIQEIIDLRCWAAGGGMYANDDLALSYLTTPGARVHINGVDWACTIVSGSPVWMKAATVGSVALHGWTLGLAGPLPPSAAFLMQSGSMVRTTDNSGYARFSWPRPFPNGLLSVVLTAGDDWANGRIAFFNVAGRPDTFGSAGYGNQAEVVYVMQGSDASGNNWGKIPNKLHRVNFIAIGW